MFILGIVVGILIAAAATLVYVNYLNGLHAAALDAAAKASQQREQQRYDAGYLDGATNYQLARTV